MLNFESHIAWRYLFSKKGHNAINIVSGISAAAVAVVTAAMICVLSVMNGFGTLVERMFSEFDPVLLVVPTEGQTLRTDTMPIASLYAREDIETISMQLEQTAMIRYKDHQIPARVVGVDSLFTRTAHIDSIIADGFFSVWDGAFERTVLGRGLAAQIGMNAHFTGALHFYAPQRTGRLNMLRPDQSLRHEHAFIAGTFAINQLEYDNQMTLVSLPMAQRLFDYDEHTATALRIQPKRAQDTDRIHNEIARILGPGYKVMNRYEQQADFFRILRIEKLLTVLLLVFILLIACFNIIGSLSMLIIDKREDIRILSDLGADEHTIRRIFRLEGWLISCMGTIAGLVIGVGVSLGQQHFGWLKLGTGSEYVIAAYPVMVQASDIVMVGAIVLILGLLAAYYPTRKIALAIVPLLMIACTPTKIIDTQSLPTTFTSAWEETYGQHYDSIPLCVVALDLYSEGLRLDTAKHQMAGTGYNLYLSDIFLPERAGADSIHLANGTYQSLDPSTLHTRPYTFLPGRDYEGTPNGIYLLYVENGKLQSIQVIESGQMVVCDTTNGQRDIRFRFQYTNADHTNATYECSFQGTLQLWDKR